MLSEPAIFTPGGALAALHLRHQLDSIALRQWVAGVGQAAVASDDDGRLLWHGKLGQQVLDCAAGWKLDLELAFAARHGPGKFGVQSHGHLHRVDMIPGPVAAD